jgi:capsid protein
VLKSTIREGDCGVYFGSDGKLYYFESDQFVEINKADWVKQADWTEDVVTVEGGKAVTKKLPLLQEQGVIYNRLGKVLAHSVSAKRGISSAKISDVTIIPVSEFRLIKSSYRLNQLRGVSELLPCIADCLDLYAMRASEIQSAKLASKYAIAIQKAGALEDSIMRAGTDAEGLLDAPAKATAQGTYESFDELTGGFTEYLEPGESANLLKNERPNNGLKDFFGFVLGGAGAGVGLSKTYTDLNCEKSYFAARGDMLLGWQTFMVFQKFMERHFFDWVAEKAIEFFAPQMGWKLPENWQAKMSWIFPSMPLLDEKKKADTDASNLDNLLTDYSELLGPDWQDKLAQRQAQEYYLKSIGLARVNKTTGGSPVETTDTTIIDEATNEEK